MTQIGWDDLCDKLSHVEMNLSIGYREVRNWDKAQHYCEKSTVHAKQMMAGEDKIRRVFDTLTRQGDLHAVRGKLTKAKTTMEETYTYVSEVYNLEHPKVLEAGSKLIDILNQKGNHYDAEHFARVCYDSLIRPRLDPESFAAANATTDLSCAIYDMIKANGLESADIDEAEMLAREGLRIMRKLKDPGSMEIKWNYEALVQILFFKKDFSDGTKTLLEGFLSDAKKCQ
jgi:hypothetical protein